MRHHRDHKQLSRTAEHRRALLRNLVTALFEYERIETTVTKAKEARRLAERMITYAKRNNLHSRRLVARVVQKPDVADKLFVTITPWYAARQGGYTRILKTRKRLGDGGEMAILELVKTTEQKDADRKARAAALEAKAARKKAAEEEKTPGQPPVEEAAKEEKPAEKRTGKKKTAAKKETTAKKTTVKKKATEKPEAKKTEAKEPAEKKAKKEKKGGLLGRIRRKKTDG